MSILTCIVIEHDLMLVLLAAVICILGAATTTRLQARLSSSGQGSKGTWLFLGSLAAGATIWCTHFVAMLAYRPGAEVTYEPVLTAVSLLVAMGGCALALAVGSSQGRWRAEAGGALFGMTTMAMHYTGMSAFAVDAAVFWSAGYVALSGVLSVLLGALAFNRLKSEGPQAQYLAPALLVASIVALHFTGMTAMTVQPFAPLAGAATGQDASLFLALGVGALCILVLGVAVAGHALDQQARAEGMTVQMAQERRISHLARNDSLTGLPNRTSFLEKLSVSMAAGRPLALLAMDLDRFKEVNDMYGHAVGDDLLVEVSQRMAAAAEPGEFVARLGGDEFVMLFACDDRDEAMRAALRFRDAVIQPLSTETGEVMCGASIGIALWPHDADEISALMNNADLAMYRAKNMLTVNVCFYEEEMDEAVRDRRRLVQNLREALDQRQFTLHYQVQTSVGTGAVTGYEVLLRWPQADGSFVPPAEFIPLAEETGLILQIGEWVLRTACREAMSWPEPHRIAVNLSPLQLSHIDLPRLVHEVLIETGLPPSRLELEITETAMISDLERSVHVLRQLKALGVTMAMDDFGTGYSSLSTLQAFPFDKIKLDRSFLAELESSPQSRAILKAVLALGESLEIPVLAEGVETAEQLAYLREQGCDEAQGYFLGRPGVYSGQGVSTEASPEGVKAA